MGRRDTSRSPRNAKRSSARRAFFKSSRDIPREKARYVFGRAAFAGSEAAGAAVPAGSGDREKLWAET